MPRKGSKNYAGHTKEAFALAENTGDMHLLFLFIHQNLLLNRLNLDVSETLCLGLVSLNQLPKQLSIDYVLKRGGKKSLKRRKLGT